MGHVFISYSHKDSKYAHALAGHLQKMGFGVWIDERLDYGAQWPHEIQRQLDACDAFILVMSPNSFASEWVQSELQRAKRKQKPIFPLLLKGDEPWLSVESTQYYDVRGGALPDTRFYSALKRVVTVGPKADTFTRVPKSAVTGKIVAAQSDRSRGFTIAGIGIGLLLLIVCTAVGAILIFNAWNPWAAPPAPTQRLDVEGEIQPEPTDTAADTEIASSPQPPTTTPRPLPTDIVPPTATFTRSPIPPTWTPSFTVTPQRDTSFYMEGENGQLGNGAYADPASTASQGYCVNFNAAGTVKFTLRNMRAGQYTVIFHYAKYANNTTQYPDTGFQNLYVNDDPDPVSVYYTKTFGDTGGVSWSDTSVTVGLEDGTNTLLLAAISGVIGGSVDYVYVNIIQ